MSDFVDYGLETFSQQDQQIGKLTEANAAMAQRLSAATALLREWLTPVNWEDGSALVEGRLIEGKRRLCDDTTAFLASPDAVVQQRADAVRAAYDNALRIRDFIATVRPHRRSEALLIVYERAHVIIATLRQAFPELQS